MTTRRGVKRRLPDWMGALYYGQDRTEGLHNGTRDEVRKSSKALIGSRSSNDHAAMCASEQACSSSGKLICTEMKKSCARDATDKGKQQRSAEEILRLSLPLLTFNGSLIYSYNSSDCSLLCEEIMMSSSRGLSHIGFDMEWAVSYAAGPQNKVALIQMCTAEDKCYLFHISAMGTFPSGLKTFLADSRVIKYGINIEADFWKLERDFDGMQARKIIRESVVDLGKLANVKLKSAERWTLDGLTRNVLRKRLDKNASVRCGKWDQYPLSDGQLQYAAADAYAGLLLANSLRDT